MFSSSALGCFFVAVFMVLTCSGAPAPEVPSISLPPEIKFWSIVKNDVPSPYIGRVYPVQDNGFVYTDNRPMKLVTSDNFYFTPLHAASPCSGNLQGFWRTWSYPPVVNQPVPQFISQPVPQFVNQPLPEAAKPIPESVPSKYIEADEMNKNTHSRKKRHAFFPMMGMYGMGMPMYGGGYGNNYAYSQAGAGSNSGYYGGMGMGYPFMGR
ncbi:hypothetical protein C0J52_17731 [Blattella germanica]|nr:hypothetical protein C0J52_17731 [Blattella germanica]